MMMNNGDQLKDDRLAVIEARIKELEPKKKFDPFVRKELSDLYNEKVSLTNSPQEDLTKPKLVIQVWLSPDGNLELKSTFPPPIVIYTFEKLKLNLLTDEPKVVQPKGSFIQNLRRFKR
jgi:hypothetical protein